MDYLSKHAKTQIAARGVITEADVNRVIGALAPKIQALHVHEVRVIVKVFSSKIVCSDGSNGNLVVACVDGRTCVVKTVMLTRAAQVERKSREVPYLEVK